MHFSIHDIFSSLEYIKRFIGSMYLPWINNILTSSSFVGYSPNRLPAYEAVFRRSIALQNCRYPQNKKLVDLQMDFFEGDLEETPELNSKLTTEEREKLKAAMSVEKITYADVPVRLFRF